jgi:hypothetical protein
MKAYDFSPSIDGQGDQLLHNRQIVALVCVAMFKLSSTDPNISHDYLPAVKLLYAAPFYVCF